MPPDIALVPLDDRPCNRLFPQQLAPISGCRVALPPREHLGWFTRPGDCDAVTAWLQESTADRIVLSTDMLCYGGLVASRSSAVDETLALTRMEALRDLRRTRPDARIFAFSIIMRLGTTVASAADLESHQALLAYSQLVDRVERLGDETARTELNAVIERLDAEVLSEYLTVRRRNHTINRAALRLVADGVLDYLILAQEDAAPVGLHVPEQVALRDQADEFRISDRVAIHPGADEAGIVLMARHHCAEAAHPLPLAIDYATDEGSRAVPQYENHSLYETVESQARAAGAALAPIGEADAILFLHTPIGQQGDIAEAPAQGESPMLAAQAEGVVERTRFASEAGRLVGLADVAYSNGADPELIAALARSGGANHLAAFAGWNTAANTIGTAISTLCLAAAGGRGPADEASRGFLACRLADDYAYQSCVRRRALSRAEAAGANPYALGEAAQEMEAYVREELVPLAHQVFSDLLGPGRESLVDELRVSLPWRRLFEVEVEVPLVEKNLR